MTPKVVNRNECLKMAGIISAKRLLHYIHAYCQNKYTNLYDLCGNWCSLSSIPKPCVASLHEAL